MPPRLDHAYAVITGDGGAVVAHGTQTYGHELFQVVIIGIHLHLLAGRVCVHVWQGEFGGGIKGGMSYGSTDAYGYNIQENVVHVRDLHATLLHCLGIDHERFTYKFQGLDAKLTGVEESRVVHEILA